MATLGRVQVVEMCRVSPPKGSVSDTSLPLTCFDVIWLQLPPVQRLFFYHLPPKPHFSITHFQTSLLPTLKQSLSLALRLFFPLAAHLTPDHLIRYADGDSISLTIATSDADFRRLVADYPRITTEFHPLVPKLHATDSNKQPLLALQITVFPNSGICIGTTTHHAAADGSSSIHFMKTWASIFSAGDESQITSPPFHDRSATRTLDKLKNQLVHDLARLRIDHILEAASVKHRSNPVRATFQINPTRIQLIHQHVSAQRQKHNRKPLNCSPFTLAISFVWVCLLRARNDDEDAAVGKSAHLAFLSGCRARLQPPIPNTYFGNCVAPQFVEVSMNDLCSEDGVRLASEAIWRKIQGLESGALEGAEKWVQRAGDWGGERVVTFAGSPKIRVYDTDFGWGKPRKVEIISIEETGALSLAESREEDGGFEVGLALPKAEMERFAALFDESFRAFSDAGEVAVL